MDSGNVVKRIAVVALLDEAHARSPVYRASFIGLGTLREQETASWMGVLHPTRNPGMFHATFNLSVQCTACQCVPRLSTLVSDASKCHRADRIPQERQQAIANNNGHFHKLVLSVCAATCCNTVLDSTVFPVSVAGDQHRVRAPAGL